MAEKEARAAGIAPDTPYSGDSSQPLHRKRRGLAGLDDEPTVSIPRGLADGGSRRSSVVYSSLRNAASVGTGLGGGGHNGGGGRMVGASPAEPQHLHPHPHPQSSSSPSSSSSSSIISLHEPYADLVQEQFHRSTSRAATGGDDDHEADTEQSPLSPDGGDGGGGGSSSNIMMREETRPRPSGGGSRTGTPQLGPTRLLRSDTPGAMSISDYLHEDGMTEDEIRRLEEEERALDEAIERARTDSRAGGGR